MGGKNTSVYGEKDSTEASSSSSQCRPTIAIGPKISNICGELPTAAIH